MWGMIRDFEMGLKRKLYELMNGRHDSLYWDAEKRKYVAHFENTPQRDEAPRSAEGTNREIEQNWRRRGW